MPRKFHLGDILSVTTPLLVSPKGMVGVSNLINYMVGDHVGMTVLSNAASICKPYLLKQYPFLIDIDTKEVNKRNWQEWLAKCVENYGEEFEIKSINEFRKDIVT